jgi:hypothetical protein
MAYYTLIRKIRLFNLHPYNKHGIKKPFLVDFTIIYAHIRTPENSSKNSYKQTVTEHFRTPHDHSGLIPTKPL